MATYYWVSRGIGFSTAWNDAGNWSSSSGGGGGAGIPTSTDDAVVDENSFLRGTLQAITVTNIYSSVANECENFTISNLALPMTLNLFVRLTVNGNLFFQSGGITRTAEGQIIFNGSGSHTVNTNGVGLTTVTFQNGTYTLQNDLTGTNLTLSSGTLDLNGRTLSFNTFSSPGSTSRTLAFNGGTINLAGSNAAVWNSNNTNYNTTGTPSVNFVGSPSSGTRTINTGAVTEANAVSFNILGGTDTITIGASDNVSSLNFTGFGGTWTSSTRTIYGSLTVSSGMTVSGGTGTTTFAATSGTQTIATSGKQFDFPVTFNGVGGTWQLQDSLSMGSTRTLTLTNGTLDANNQNVSCGTFSSSNSNARVVTMGSGTWTIQSSGTAWNCGTSTNLTVNANTSTVNITSASSVTFAGGSKTYNVVSRAGGGNLVITGANTFTTVATNLLPITVTFPSSATQTITNFNISGTSGNTVTINSSTSGTKATITRPAYAVVSVSHCNIKDIYASEGAYWEAYTTNGNTNLGNNFGWTFGGEFFGVLVHKR
jgi:hypothetical protein